MDRVRRREPSPTEERPRARVNWDWTRAIIFGEAIPTRSSRSWMTSLRQDPRETTCAISVFFSQTKLAPGEYFRRHARAGQDSRLWIGHSDAGVEAPQRSKSRAGIHLQLQLQRYTYFRVLTTSEFAK